MRYFLVSETALEVVSYFLSFSSTRLSENSFSSIRFDCRAFLCHFSILILRFYRIFVYQFDTFFFFLVGSRHRVVCIWHPVSWIRDRGHDFCTILKKLLNAQCSDITKEIVFLSKKQFDWIGVDECDGNF